MATIDLSQLVTAEMKAEQAHADMLARYKRAIEDHLDAVVAKRDYASIHTCIRHLSSTITQWAAEAAAARDWSDAVWLHAYAELDKVTAGERPAPSVEDFLAELPAMTWPE